jgi:transposase
MQALIFCSCGVDVHEKMIEACIIKGGAEDDRIVLRQQFSTMQEGLISFAQWLHTNECFHIAMESTGVYWMPVYEAIEKYCHYYEKIYVVNAHHFKNLPGRKSDIKDAEWLAGLLRHGLLSSSYVPERLTRNLREASRLYKKAKAERSRYINRVEKLLQSHGIKLSSVLSDVLCVSGRNILNILAVRGSLTVSDVESCLRGRTKFTAAEIHSSASSSLNTAECAMLTLLLKKVDRADDDIYDILSIMSDIAAPYETQLTLIDSVYGIDSLSALLILAEIGHNPHLHFSTSERLCSWAGLCPRNDQSAGKVFSRKILPGNPYIKSILCQVAWVAVKNRNNPYGKWFWSHQSKIGRKKAIVAVSRKILSAIYCILRDGTFFDPDYEAGRKKTSTA